ncbi:double-strand break repair helicase AddA [Nioella aestuarii]|uniref:double-strand break repair helicase AddA n=1 Tax=Nioella aestuarii TaxID=1662864 RepID=UPI003D7F48A3
MTLKFDEATTAQITAANPAASTWLSANAGSGKTRVLTDRVARLLLQDVPPERILCLTYTKAAASEMQNRLFKRLGEWAMKPDADLRSDLLHLGMDAGALTSALLSHARTLFARAIETPGGLKIQTIHSFCSAVLRRFPLEAGVAPNFTEMDERAQAMLCADVLDGLADGDGQDAVDALAAHVSGDDPMPLIRALLGKRLAFETDWPDADIMAWFDLPKGLDQATLLAQVFTGDERDLCHKLMPGLNPSYSHHKAAVSAIPDFPWDAPRLSDLEKIEKALLSASDAKKDPDQPRPMLFGNKAVIAAMGEDLDQLTEFGHRLAEARPIRRALLAAEKTLALHRFARGFLPAYDAAKSARGWLDFDDLILATRRLLANSGVAQWVLFRLDGGIDHILVDEAQDTSPAQWDIVAQLAEEFAAGSGARSEVERTIFVVGDKKQSIYSFQGADPDGFDRMRDHFAARLQNAEAAFQSCALAHSFRSAPPILHLVDKVFEGPASAGVGQDVTHIAFKQDLPGRVDIWPVVEKSDSAEKPDWDDPVDQLADDHHTVRLSRAIAADIKRMIRDGTPITVEGTRRPVTAGDILILVQRRSDLFHELIAAIKEQGLPIAGADRMRLAAELAVKDLTALLSFLATPEDDLSLAAVLRSPLCGWSEKALHDLAYGRDRGYLWRVLQQRRDMDEATVAMLEDLRNHADFLRPYDLLERILIRHNGRRNLLARMGNEAEDGIDAMLAQALAYERMEVPSLTGFTGWLQADDVQIKRDPGSAGDQIRVMSVHGAKGLEAPVVILPDTAYRQSNHTAPKLFTTEGGPVCWAGRKDDSPAAMRDLFDEAAAREVEERNRLLYVAMTRAESWLIVAAAGDIAKGENEGWYPHILAAAQACNATPHPMPTGQGWRLETGDWTVMDHSAQPAPQATALPDWLHNRPKTRPRDATTLSPSDLGGAKALPGDGSGLDEDAAKLRGRRLHLLLEHLPDLPQSGWRAAAPGILAVEGDLSDVDLAELFEEATTCLTTPALAALFIDDALAEVTLTAPSPTLGRTLLGQIDRLIIAADHILAVDFKSNATAPDRAEDTPEGILRQMGAYAEMLAAIYPDIRIDTAILWTRPAWLMPLPAELTTPALIRARTEPR